VTPSVPVRRLTGAALLLAAVLVVGSFVAVVRDDSGGAVALLILLAVVTVPVLVAAAVSVRPAVDALRGREVAPSVVPCAALLALGALGVVALSLQVGRDRELEDGDLVGAGVGGLALVAALLALGAALPGRHRALHVLAAVTGGVLLLGLVALRAVAQTG
jgi:hypothetical protein